MKGLRVNKRIQNYKLKSILLLIIPPHSLVKIELFNFFAHEAQKRLESKQTDTLEIKIHLIIGLY